MMETEVELRNMKSEGVGQVEDKESCTIPSTIMESTNSLTESGITETISNGASETVSSSVAQLLISDNASEEISSKKEPTQPLSTDKGQEKPKESDTMMENDNTVNDVDDFLQILMEIDSVQRLNEGQKSQLKSPYKRKTSPTAGIRKKRQRTRTTRQQSPIKLEMIETPDESGNETVLSSLPSSVKNDSMLDNATPKTTSEVIEINNDNASGIRNEASDEVSCSTNSMNLDLTSNDVAPETIHVSKSRKRGRPPKNRIAKSMKELIQSQGMEVTNDTGNGIRDTDSTKILPTSCSMEIDSMTDNVLPKTVSMPKCRGRKAKKLTESKVIGVNNITASSTEDTPTKISSTISMRTNSMSVDVAPKITSVPKCRGGGKWPKDVIGSKVLGANNTEREIFRDTTAERLQKVDSTIEAVIQEAIRASQSEDLPNENKPAETGVKTDSLDSLKSKPELTCKDETSNDLTEKEVSPMNENLLKELLKVKSISSETSVHAKPESEMNLKKEITTKPECTVSEKPTVDNVGGSNHQIDKTKDTPSTNLNKNLSLIKLKQAKVILWNIAYSDKLTPQQKEMLSRRKESNKYGVSSKSSPASWTDQRIKQSTLVNITITSPDLGKTTSAKSIHSVLHMKSEALEDKPSTSKKRRRSKKPKITTQSNVRKQKPQPKMHASRSILLPPRDKSMHSTEASTTSKTNLSFSSSNNQLKPRPFSGTSLLREKLMQWNDIKSKPTEQVGSDCKDYEKQLVFETTELELPLDLSIWSSKKSIDCQSDVTKSPNTSLEVASQTSKSLLPRNTSLTNFQYCQDFSHSQRTNESREESSDINGNEKLQDIRNGNSQPINSTAAVSSRISANSKLATEQTQTMHEPGKECHMASKTENVIVKKKTVFENANEKINTISMKRSLPKIVSDEALPKGTIPFVFVECKPTLRSDIKDNQRFNHLNKTQVCQEPIDSQLITNSQTLQEDHKIIETQSEKPCAEDINMELNSINAEPFDSTQLWKICPEFATFFDYVLVDDDDNINNNNNNNNINHNIDKNIINNINEDTDNNDNKLLNLDTLKTIETKNTDLPIIAARETKTHANDEDLLLNNAAHVVETENDPKPVSIGTIATNVNYIANEIDVESSEGIATEVESEIEKPVVLANLTIANLTNFTKNSNHDEIQNRLSNYVDCCQYSSYGEMEKCNEVDNENKVSNVCDETCSHIQIVSTMENPNGYLQGKAKTSKRKWIKDEKKDTSYKPITEKKRKLNRKSPLENAEGSSATVCSYPVPVSVVSNNSNMSVRTVVHTNTSPENTSYESKLLEEEVKEVGKTEEEREMISSEYNVSQDCDLNIPDCDKINKKINFSTQNLESKDIIDNEDVKTIEHNYENENLLADEPCSTNSTTAVEKEFNSEFDENGNSISSSSSSSSSPSSSDKSSSNLDKTISSKILVTRNLDEGGADYNRIYQPQNEPKEELDYEPDDCISLFAESIISTHVDENLTFLNNNTPSYSPPTKPQDGFHSITDVGTYFAKNVQECNAVYESATEMNENRHATDPNDMPDAFTYNDTYNFDIFSCSKIPMLDTNLKQKYSGRPLKYSESDSLQETVVQEENHADNETLTNVKNRTCVETDSLDNHSTHFNVQDLFKGHCFLKMKQGVCHKKKCRFRHHLTSNLQNIDQRNLSEIDQIFDYAIFYGFKYFTTYFYREFVTRMDADNIFMLFCKLLNANEMNNHILKCTIDALASTGMPLRIIMKNIANELNENEIVLTEQILSAVESEIEPGTYWEILRDLLVRKHPPEMGLHRVIEECVYMNKDKSHMRDVYINYVRKFTAEKLSNVNIHLKEQFDYLVAENELINEAENSDDLPPFFENNNFQVSAQSRLEQRYNIPTISSPDINQQFEKLLQLPQKDIQVSQTSTPQGSFASQSFEKNENSSSLYEASTHDFFHRRRDTVSQVSSSVKHDSPDLGVRTEKYEAGGSFDGIYKLHEIDDLAAPRSAYRERHCDFHLSITILNEVLKNQDYETVLNILNKYSDTMDKTLFTTSLYNILRKNVITSAHHLKNMIKLSVKMRVTKFLSRTLFTLGIYTMIELCDDGAWVFAYDLFKSLRNTDSLENIAEFTLISAEIYLANGRPLKAFNMLKRNNMFSANRNKWRLDSNPNDEHVRIRVISLLSDVLCKEYPEQAFYLFTQLCREQGHTYHPTDLTALIDKLVIGIMNGKCSELITEVGRFVLKSNFSLEHSIFRNLTVRIFEKDTRLAKQLYHYGTWLGIYPIVKLTLPLHIMIKTNWTKEEMYLVVLDFLEKLSMDVGPAIDRIGPNKFNIHLVFELTSFEERFFHSKVQMRNMDELNMSKKLMKTVLKEQFNPSISTVQLEQGRFVKIKSSSVVNYLKAMSVRQ